MTPLRATYRLQFRAGFTFADARRLVPYLARLGISHIYASPVFAARPGSAHGYDGIDPNRINPELGGEEDFQRLVAALREAGLGLILDIVPNHLAIHRSNVEWMAALCLGPGASETCIFDIDWSGDRLLLPFLGEDPATALAGGDIHLELDRETGLLVAAYHEHGFALRPATVADLLTRAGAGETLTAQWRSLESDPDRGRLDEARGALAKLDGMPSDSLERALAEADVAAILEDQHWRLADWRSAAESLSHRRFFNIAELIGVRVEDPAIFTKTQKLAVDLVRRGYADGLRIDHIDGLADPEDYCRRLREAAGSDALIFVEKILGPEEALPDWPVDGTTGYERLNEINRLFVDPAGHARLDRHLVERGLLAESEAERLAAAKRQVLQESFRPELDALSTLAGRVTETAAPPVLREAVLALLVHFPVYRSYGSARGHSASDEAVWQEAAAAVRAHESEEVAGLAEALVEAVQRDGDPNPVLLRTRFQQLSGPAMAKGLEDTELYRSIALASVNEVGGHPDAPAMDPETGHRLFAARAGHGDTGLIPLATHDTKRGADTRARLNVLSWNAEGWIGATDRWSRANRPLKELVDGIEAPDELDEWLIYQTLFGAWPIGAERLGDYMLKALREAKRHTRWEEPNEPYEKATLAFAAALVSSPQAAEFRRDFESFVDGLEPEGRVNSIAQAILQMTLPGVPDIYQGTEFWDFSLVDPDNRRPVDWAVRTAALERASPPVDLDQDPPGLAKMGVTRSLLALRAARPGLFSLGEYSPVADAGEGWFAFIRGRGGEQVLVAVPLRGTPDGKPQLPPGGWQDEITVGHPGSRPDWPFVVATRT